MAFIINPDTIVRPNPVSSIIRRHNKILPISIDLNSHNILLQFSCVPPSYGGYHLARMLLLYLLPRWSPLSWVCRVYNLVFYVEIRVPYNMGVLGITKAVQDMPLGRPNTKELREYLVRVAPYREHRVNVDDGKLWNVISNVKNAVSMPDGVSHFGRSCDLERAKLVDYFTKYMIPFKVVVGDESVLITPWWNDFYHLNETWPEFLSKKIIMPEVNK